MTNKEAIDILINYFKPPIIRNDGKSMAHLLALEAIGKAVDALEADPKEIFYDGYAYCLLDFGKDTVLCKDCKHYKQSAVADRKMCFRKDVDGIEVCYDFLPYDSCTYGERKVQEVTVTVKPQCAPPNSVDSTIYTPEGKLL